MSPDLKFRRKSLRQLATARDAFALVGVTEVSIARKRVNREYCQDRTTRHRFSVTADTADFLLEQLGQADMSSFDALVLEPLVAQLEAGKDAADAETAADLVEAEELARWQPEPRLPELEDPGHFIETFGKLLEQADGDLRQLQRLYAAAMKAEPEE